MESAREYYDLQVGHQIGPISYSVSTGDIERYALGSQNHNPWFFCDSPFGARICPSVGTARAHRLLLDAGYSYGGLVMHAKHESEFLVPARLGKRITVDAKLFDKFVKRGRKTIVLQYSCVDEDGSEIARHLLTNTEPVPSEQDQEVGEPRAKAVVKVKASQETPVAPVRQLEPLSKKITTEDMLLFSGPGRNFHNDDALARQFGFPGAVAEGLLAYSYICEMLECLFGELWFSSGKLDVTFAARVYSGDKLTVFGRTVRAVDTGETNRLAVELDVENQRGQIVAIAKASGLHPSEAL